MQECCSPGGTAKCICPRPAYGDSLWLFRIAGAALDLPFDLALPLDFRTDVDLLKRVKEGSKDWQARSKVWGRL